MKTPLLQRPLYLDGAPPKEAAAMAADACKACATGGIETARRATIDRPFAGLVGAAVLGATAAYFVPKILDPLLTTWRARDQADDVEFEVEE